MKKKELGIGTNIAYSMISQIVALIVPLITAPYIARIFNAELIGQYSYVLSISTYFVLLECLGIALYGQIKVASIRDDRKELSIIFFEILFLKIFLMLLCIALYIILIVRYSGGLERKLYLVMVVNIIANGIDMTWFLNGMEKFKTIAIRSILVRVCNIVMILILVNQKEDILLYAWIMQGTALLSNIAILPVIRKEVKWLGFKKMNMKRHMKPAAVYFVPGLITTIFSSTDRTMLGVFSNNYEVGVYEQASKISNICMSAISAIGNVLLPRATYIYSKTEGSLQGKRMLYQSLNIVMFISMPVTLGICAIAPVFVPLFFGSGYEKSVILLKILSFNVLFSSLGNLFGQQCLIARKKQREYNVSIVISALINIALNFILIVKIQSIGAAVASVISSMFILIFIAIKSADIISVKNILTVSWNYIVSAVFMVMIIEIVSPFIPRNTVGLILNVAIGAMIYIVSLVLMKNCLIKQLIDKIRWKKS